ncbi:MAG: pyridoxamine 5'-phosphate oxidase family protein [Polyangiales bacterium]
MRREHLFRMPHDEAVSLIARAPVAHLASTDDDGAPVLRAVHPVVIDGWALFHAAPVGEKTRCLGRPAVLSVEEVVAEVPSYFTDPSRACPATTLYRSAQAHGALTEVRSPALKAAALQALMEKYQPEGGHVPIFAEHRCTRSPSRASSSRASRSTVSTASRSSRRTAPRRHRTHRRGTVEARTTRRPRGRRGDPRGEPRRGDPRLPPRAGRDAAGVRAQRARRDDGRGAPRRRVLAPRRRP